MQYGHHSELHHAVFFTFRLPFLFLYTFSVKVSSRCALFSLWEAQNAYLRTSRLKAKLTFSRLYFWHWYPHLSRNLLLELRWILIYLTVTLYYFTFLLKANRSKLISWAILIEMNTSLLRVVYQAVEIVPFWEVMKNVEDLRKAIVANFLWEKMANAACTSNFSHT